MENKNRTKTTISKSKVSVLSIWPDLIEVKHFALLECMRRNEEYQYSAIFHLL